MASRKIFHPPLTVEMLKSVLRYEPKTGKFIWIAETKFKPGRLGCEAGSICTSGHRQIKIFGKVHSAHRLAWLYMTGEWPNEALDHKDRNPDNNVWTNIREAPGGSNSVNRLVYGKSSVWPRGVTPNGKRFKAQASIDGIICYLGTHDTPEQAHAAYLQKIMPIRGEFLPE